MKIAVITDIHYGVRNDSPHFIDANRRFFREVYFPKLDEELIEHVVFMGDLVDRRKYINFMTAHHMRVDFMEPHRDKGVHIDAILGNHDVYYKNTNEFNALRELYRDCNYVTIFDEPFERTFGTGEDRLLYLPWCNPSNKDQLINAIQDSRASVVFGHLELEGFAMDKHTVSQHGAFERKLLDKFDVVASGHYHHASEQGNIKYLGSHAQFTWADHGDKRGFHIFDTETREFTFVENPFNMFEKVHYSEKIDMAEVVRDHDFSNVEGKYVKVVVHEREDIPLFNMFMDKIEKANPIDVQVVDDHLNLDLTEDDEIVDEAQDTLTIFRRAIETSNTSGIDQISLDNFVTNLYQEALSVE